MEKHNEIEFKRFKGQFRLQLVLLFLISIIVSLPIELFTTIFNSDYHITEPIVGGILSILLIFLIFLFRPSYTNHHKSHRILHFVSSFTLLFFSILVLSTKGHIVKAEIAFVFVIFLPIELYVLISTWAKTSSDYYKVSRPGINPKQLFPLLVLSIILGCLVVYPLSFTLLGLLIVLGLSIPIFFFSLIVREFLI